MSYQSLQSLPIIDEEAVASVLQWAPLIDEMEAAMVAFSHGHVAQPVRQIVPIPGQNGIIAAMPAIGDVMAVKVVTLYHDNAGTDIPTHQAVVLVFDKTNGSPIALMDGRLITEMRTAAASAAAARKLAPAEPEVVTIMGSGVQARAHAAALAEVREWSELRLWARDEQRGMRVANELGARFVSEAQEAVSGADIVVCATSATTPILEGAWLKAGAFVSAVGWNTPEGRELDSDTMSNTVIVESLDAALDQSGNVRVSGCEVFAEIGEIYAGDKAVEPGATVIYDSIGMAIMDVAAAGLVYDLWSADET